MLDFVQQLVSGIALGCVYGLIALGFVLVYKATEVVNFAQGDLMMLGGFFAFTFISLLGFNYWLGFIAAVGAMALFGMLAERLVVRPILGYPQFSIIMATIGLVSSCTPWLEWSEAPTISKSTPFSHGVLRLGSLVLAHDKLSVIAATVILCGVLYLFFNKTTLGTAMRASSEYACRLLHGHPGQAPGVDRLGDQCSGGDLRRRAACAHHFRSFECGSRAWPEGISSGCARRFSNQCGCGGS